MRHRHPLLQRREPPATELIGATPGDTHGVADDAGPASHPLTVDNLFRQVRQSARQARSYEEPGRYLRPHPEG